jgi:uncharacterized cupin superfamily protein
MNKIHVTAVPEEEQRSPGGKFHSWSRNLSLALGGVRNAGLWGGGHPFDLQIRRIPAGAAVCPFHVHFAQWEMFVILHGNATVRAGSESHPAVTGDVFIHPPGEAHQLSNPGPGDLEVLIIADNPQLDAFHYPDSDKWGFRPPGKIFRLTEVDYFDREDPAPAGTAPHQIKPAPAGPPLTPFTTRKLHPDSLPWEPWDSPKGKFRGTGKSLSIALGAKAKTPTGLGGHPFDLELGKLAPGQCGCPFHAHSSQWELYYFLSGAGTFRTAAGQSPVGPGDLVLTPPGDAHQFTNTGTEDLLYYLVADNPPVDIWHYPDSNKWGHSNSRKFFRATDADYWDGEE